MANEMNDIRIDIGVNTKIEIDLSEFDFDGVDAVIFTIKNRADVNSPVVFEERFTAAGVYVVEVEAEESRMLTGKPVYDFDVLIGEKRYKITENGNVIVRKGVGASDG